MNITIIVILKYGRYCAGGHIRKTDSHIKFTIMFFQNAFHMIILFYHILGKSVPM